MEAPNDSEVNSSKGSPMHEASPNHAGSGDLDVSADRKPQVIYRCKKCRRIVATEEQVVPHEPGEGQICFKWKKRSNNPWDKEQPQCSSIFVEPMKWMEVVEEGCVQDKLLCLCKARLGYFNWAGMQCNCGAWINPAFQLHKNRLDECNL